MPYEPTVFAAECSECVEALHSANVSLCRLHASAPALLAALRQFVEYVEAQQDPDEEDARMAREGRIALALALVENG